MKQKMLASMNKAERALSTTYVEILGVNVVMLGLVEVLLGHEHTLCSKTKKFSWIVL